MELERPGQFLALGVLLEGSLSAWGPKRRRRILKGIIETADRYLAVCSEADRPQLKILRALAKSIADAEEQA